MSNQAKKSTRSSRRNGAKRKRAREQNQAEFGAYAMGDAIVGGELFDPLTGQFDFRPLTSEVVNVVGDPTSFSGEPTMRAATLDDVEDDCPLCQEMRRQILAGNPPQVLAYE